MAAALEAVSLQTGLQPFYADGIVAGKQSPALKGNYSKREARPIFMSATLGRPTTSCRAGPAGDGNGYVGDLNLKPEVANTISITGDYTLWNSPDYGRFALTGVGGFAQGDDLDNHTGLWHMMPFNIKSALEHKLGGLADSTGRR